MSDAIDLTGLIITMRKPCGDCGAPDGRIETRNGQDVVFCASCGKHAGYNAPKHETGRAATTLRSRPDISPKRRARLLERDNYTCIGCHRTDKPLDIGHLLSVEEGRSLGASDLELWDDENLAAMCKECNNGLSGRSVSLRLILMVLRARILQRQRQAAS